MVDTTTPLLGLLLMGVGGDNNAWGTNLNNSVITPIENAIAGTTQLAITGGAVTLTAAQALSAIIVLTGTLTSNATLTVPTLSKKWTFMNRTTGAFSVLVKTAAQTTPTQLPQGKATDIFIDISLTPDAAVRLDRSYVGNLFHHAGAAGAAGVLTCAGQSLLIASYPDLFAEIGTTWGGNGTTNFTLPDGQTNSRFVRSAGGALAVGTYQSNQNASHTHAITGAPGIGSLSTASAGAHSHTPTVTDPGHAHGMSNYHQTNGIGNAGSVTYVAISTSGTAAANSDAASTGISVSNSTDPGHAHTVTGAPSVGTLATAASGGTEARPESMVGLLCIRY